MGSGIPQINKQVDQQLKGSGYFDLPPTTFVPPVVMTTSPRFTGVASQFGEGDEAAPLPDVFKGLQTRLTGGGVVTRDQLSRLTGNAAGQSGSMGLANIEININGPTYGMDDFEDKVAEAIVDGARRGGFGDIIGSRANF